MIDGKEPFEGTGLAVGQRSGVEAFDQRLSESCKVRVLFEGLVTPEAIQKLITHLELLKEGYRSVWRRGDHVRVLSNTQHRGQVGEIVKIGRAYRDMVGPVQMYWISFVGDDEGPYQYDDNDLMLL